jgi:DNA-binding response OmpR family regulator
MSDPLRILVVESDQKAAMAMAAAIRQRGWEPHAASDATLAMSVAMRAKPDLIVLNAQVSGGSSLVTLRRMRASVHTAITPVIAIGRDVANQQADMVRAGAQEFMKAPVDSSILCTTIEKHMSHRLKAVQAPADLLSDPARVAALAASGLLDKSTDASLDRITQLVTTLLDAPTALVSVVDKDRQYFKSMVGLSEPWSVKRETPLTHSFCQWVVSGREQIAIEDAREHPLLKTNHAIKDLGVVAYAGVPIYNGEGQALGSLCAIDAQPRMWSKDDLVTLHDLGKLVDGCAAHAEVAQRKPTRANEFDRYVSSAGEALTAATRIMRRLGPALGQAQRDLLLDIVDEYGDHLVQLNRLIQMSRTAH